MFFCTSAGNLTKKQATVSAPKKVVQLSTPKIFQLNPMSLLSTQMVQIHKVEESWTCRYFGGWGNSWYPWALHSYNFSIGADSSILGTNEMFFVILMLGLPRCPPENKQPIPQQQLLTPALVNISWPKRFSNLKVSEASAKRLESSVEYQTSEISKLLSHPVQLIWCIILPESLWGNKQKSSALEVEKKEIHDWLVGGWTNQLKNLRKSNWIISPKKSGWK